MLTPSSIYAPGSLIPPDGETVPPGYGQPPGYGSGPRPADGQPYQGGQPYAGPGYRNPAGQPPGPAFTTGLPPYTGSPGRVAPGYGPSARPPDDSPGFGDYAYVIREEEEFPLRQAPPEPPRSARPAHQDDRAGETGDQAAVDPVVPYGPDDPAYGPPSPDWYTREEEDDPGQPAETEVPEADPAEELEQVRGPFDPLPYSVVAEQAALHRVLAQDPADGDGEPGNSAARALGRVRDLYVAAEVIGSETLDKHFEQLLERQRELISEYFSALDDPGEATADRSVSHGGDRRGPR